MRKFLKINLKWNQDSLLWKIEKNQQATKSISMQEEHINESNPKMVNKQFSI
jgi:hypothetical protein